MLLDIIFTCECGNSNSETIHISEPNYAAERNRDSGAEDFSVVICGSCEKEYEVHTINSFGGVDCSIVGEDIEVVSDLPYFPPEETEFDWHSEAPNHYDIFRGNIESIRKLLDTELPDDSIFNFLVMTYGHTVAVIESYLAGTFIYQVTNSDELIKKLIETDPEIGKRSFTLKEIYEQQSKLRSVVAEYLQDLIFHNMKKVKPMYKEVLGHDFGDIGWLFTAIKTRHDCVHRAGFKKDGSSIDLSIAEVRQLAERAEALVESVEATLRGEEPNEDAVEFPSPDEPF